MLSPVTVGSVKPDAIKPEKGTAVGSAAPPPPVISYPSAVQVRRPEWHDDGRQFVLLLPMRPLWLFVVTRTFSFLVWTALGIAAATGFMMTMIEEQEAGGQLMCLAIAAVGLSFGIYAFVDMMRGARAQRTPTRLCLCATGLTVDTSAPSGVRRRYDFPVAVIRRVIVQLEGPVFPRDFDVRLAVLTLAGETVTFRFTLRTRESVDALKRAIDGYIPPPPASTRRSTPPSTSTSASIDHPAPCETTSSPSPAPPSDSPPTASSEIAPQSARPSEPATRRSPSSPPSGPSNPPSAVR